MPELQREWPRVANLAPTRTTRTSTTRTTRTTVIAKARAPTPPATECSNYEYRKERRLQLRLLPQLLLVVRW
ncbi:hypothetical protein JG688_00009818 [Phytophthora aleatoria]|uniref:Uncharacterized protein n=1 Tax=Phytophthora aleatoria TaxID=2496075 RepID=A0A8J5M254_9STRA|nr:hypothetical protein JG688_00009818 [Phytophthora aleatoria]